MTDYKDTIIKELDVLRRTSATEEAGVFKSRQYAAAIKTLRTLPPIYSLEDIPNQKGTGLGAKIREKIAKIIATGGLEITEEKREAANTLEAFQNIYGVGPKKAEALVEAGYTTIAELRDAVAADPKFFNKNQQIGLRYYEQLIERIPRSEMDQHAAYLMAALPAALEGVIVGSYRRGRPDSGDIDMLLRVVDPAVNAGEALAAYVEALRSSGYIKEVLAQGDHKCLAISQLPAALASGAAVARRLDLLVTPPEQFPFAVLYFTGSDGFNVRMRQHALDRGFTLNEHALTHLKTGLTVKGIKSEKDIFAALKLIYKEPAERTGPEAVELKVLSPT